MESSELNYGAIKIKTNAIFQKKHSKIGAEECWKARLVAQGFLQTFWVNFFGTYASVAAMTSLTVFLYLFIESMDVVAAFLNATLNEDINMMATLL